MLKGSGCRGHPSGESHQLNPGNAVDVRTPHQVQGVLETKGHHWLTGGRLAKYQAVLLDSPEITIKIHRTLNPAALMPAGPHTNLTRSCIETTEQVYSTRPALRDHLDNAAEKRCTDGSTTCTTVLARQDVLS